MVRSPVTLALSCSVHMPEPFEEFTVRFLNDWLLDLMVELALVPVRFTVEVPAVRVMPVRSIFPVTFNMAELRPIAIVPEPAPVLVMPPME